MYKKIVILQIFIFFAVLSGYSQTLMGLNAGVNLARMSGSYSENGVEFAKANRIGMYGGLTWDIKAKNKKSYTKTFMGDFDLSKTYLQTGILYSQQGVVFKQDFFGAVAVNSNNNTPYNFFMDNESIEAYLSDNNLKDSLNIKFAEINIRSRRNIDYITVPITWKQMWGDVYTKIGFHGQFEINSKSQTDIKYSLSNEVNSAQLIDTMFLADEKYIYDLGFNVGLGYQFPLNGEYDWFLDFSYKVGFLQMGQAYRPEEILRNSFFTFSTGIIIHGKKSNRYRKRR